MNLSRPLIVLDLETTGTWIEKDRIVEVGMVRCLPDGTKDRYVKRVNPEMPIPPNVVRLININDDDVKDAPLFREIAEEVLTYIGQADLAGFNIERFDLPVLEREIVSAGLRFDWRDRVVYDAQKIYHVNEKRDLTAAYQFYCSKKLINAHSALGDAEATVEIIEGQVTKYGAGDESIESLGSFGYERSVDFYDKERRFRWWNKELYPMFGKYARRYCISKIAQMDSAYLEWILTRDFSDEVKAMVEGVLNGQFPKPPG